LRQLELDAALEKCRNQIVFAEKRIREEKETADRQTAMVTEGASFAIRQALNKTLSGIEERERELAAFRKREKSLQVEINALALSPAQAAIRAKSQSELAALVTERFAKDAVLESTLQKLRKALQERALLTAKIIDIAGRLEFAATADFDAGRFAALLDSLPAELAAGSHDWVNWFFGQESEKESYTIGGKVTILPETLADSGVYRPGQTVLLSKERAKLLPAEEVAASVRGPVEMEVQAGNSFNPQVQKPEDADMFPVSGFIAR
jgi:hypothetical protein